MKKLAPMDVEFLANAPESMEFSATIGASAGKVFDILAEPNELGRWLKDLKDARWLTKAPYGVGSRREVKLRLITVHERFVAWEPGKRFAFVMDAASLPIVEAMGEDMRLEALGDDRCEVRWTVAYAPNRVGKVVRPLARAIFGKIFRDSLSSLKALAERG